MKLIMENWRKFVLKESWTPKVGEEVEIYNDVDDGYGEFEPARIDSIEGDRISFTWLPGADDANKKDVFVNFDPSKDMSSFIRPTQQGNDSDGDGTTDSDELRAIAKNMEDDMGPPWGGDGKSDNVISMDPHAAAQAQAADGMANQIRSMSDKELETAWNRLDPFGMNPEKQKREGHALEAEMTRRLRQAVKKGGKWAIPPKKPS